MKELSFKESVEAKCFECGVSEGSPGTRREQVACCVSVDCPNYFNRPMPRQCRNGKEHDQVEIAKVQAKVVELTEAKAERERARWKSKNCTPFDEKK